MLLVDAASELEFDPEADDAVRQSHRVLEARPPGIGNTTQNACSCLAEPDVVVSEDATHVQRNVQRVRRRRDVDVLASDELVVLTAVHQVLQLLLEREGLTLLVGLGQVREDVHVGLDNEPVDDLTLQLLLSRLLTLRYTSDERVLPVGGSVADTRASEAHDALELRAGIFSRPDLLQAELRPVGDASGPDRHTDELERVRDTLHGHERHRCCRTEFLLDVLDDLASSTAAGVSRGDESLDILNEQLLRCRTLEDLLQVLGRDDVLVDTNSLCQSMELRQPGIPATGGPPVGRDGHVLHLFLVLYLN